MNESRYYDWGQDVFCICTLGIRHQLQSPIENGRETIHGSTIGE